MPTSPRSTRCAPTFPHVDEVWVLGDIVGYGPRPNEVIAALQAMGARSVLGNHDGAAIGTVDPGDFNPDAHAAIRWTADVLDDNARAYLAALPEIRRDGHLTAVHGSPRDPIWEYIVSTAIAAANLDAFDTRWCLFGHTHYPIVFLDGRGGRRGGAGRRRRGGGARRASRAHQPRQRRAAARRQPGGGVPRSSIPRRGTPPTVG